MRIANINASKYVTERRDFVGSNLSGFVTPVGIYVVYSYDWYPLWAYIGGQWYGHKSKYSITTSKQSTKSCPDADIIILDTVDELCDIIDRV